MTTEWVLYHEIGRGSRAKHRAAVLEANDVGLPIVYVRELQRWTDIHVGLLPCALTLTKHDRRRIDQLFDVYQLAGWARLDGSLSVGQKHFSFLRLHALHSQTRGEMTLPGVALEHVLTDIARVLRRVASRST